jgi:hypothetical protein
LAAAGWGWKVTSEAQPQIEEKGAGRKEQEKPAFSSGFSPATLRTVNKLDLFTTSFGIQGV